MILAHAWGALGGGFQAGSCGFQRSHSRWRLVLQQNARMLTRVPAGPSWFQHHRGTYGSGRRPGSSGRRRRRSHCRLGFQVPAGSSGLRHLRICPTMLRAVAWGAFGSGLRPGSSGFRRRHSHCRSLSRRRRLHRRRLMSFRCRKDASKPNMCSRGTAEGVST